MHIYLICFFFFLSIPLHAYESVSAWASSEEECVRYLLQQKILEEAKYLEGTKGGAFYRARRNLFLAMNFPLEQIRPDHWELLISRGQKWDFQAIDKEAKIHSGFAWVNMEMHILEDGPEYSCELWPRSKAKTTDLLFYLDLYEDMNQSDLKVYGVIYESHETFGGSPRPIPLGNGGVLWPR